MSKASTVYHLDDDVNGVIVGGNYGQAWVTYEGRRQGRMTYPKNEQEAIALCKAIKSEIEEECGRAFKDIYPNDNGWEFRLSGI